MKMLRTIFFPALVFMMVLSTAVQSRLNPDFSAGMVNLVQQDTGRKTKMKSGIIIAHGGTPDPESCKRVFKIIMPFNS